jgi:tRNA pseudouridine55 synthase
VAKVRRLAGQRRVGHAGTLDPLAEGVLPILLGRATRLTELIQAGPKRYTAEVCLGIATSTDDAEGEVITRQPVPEYTQAQLEDVLEKFRGEIQQVPPMYSAIRVGGQRAYAVARRGGTFELHPRSVTIYDLHAESLAPETLRLDVTCSRGTYIRALARDIAASLGTVGHLTRLVRTQVGPFTLQTAVELDAIAERGVQAVVLPPDAAVLDLPAYHATDAEVARLLNGQAIAAPGLQAEAVRVYDRHGTLRWIGSAADDRLRPRISL